jgi:flagellar hook-length control protein FliK
MVSINQICEKIMAGPNGSCVNASTDINSAFLDILLNMGQTQSDVKDTKLMEVLVEDPVVVETSTESNLETTEAVEYALESGIVQMMLSQTLPLINDVHVENVVISQVQIVNENIVTTDKQSQTQALTKDHGVEVFVEEKPIVVQKNPQVFKELVQSEIKLDDKPFQKLVQTKQIEMSVEHVSQKASDEIQKHYKVLNHPLKSKDSIKFEDPLKMNVEGFKQIETPPKNEIIQSEVEISKFKQSLQEVKISLESMQRKDDETIVFKLKPEGLAEIVIKFEQKLGKVTLDISTSNKVVEQLIQKELPHLRDTLKSYQMEVNLSEMSFKNHSNQSQQSKSNQNVYNQELIQDELVEEEWIRLPEYYGFNTYV